MAGSGIRQKLALLAPEAYAIAQNIDWGSDEKTVAQLGRICDKARAIQRERALYAGEGEEK